MRIHRHRSCLRLKYGCPGPIHQPVTHHQYISHIEKNKEKHRQNGVIAFLYTEAGDRCDDTSKWLALKRL